MSIFIEKPGLPDNAEFIIIGKKYAEILDDSLLGMGLKPLYVPDNKDVDYRLSGHADLSVLHTGGASIFLAPYLKNSEFAEKISDLGFKIHFCDIIQENNYPNDAQLNLCPIGNTLIFSKNVSYPPAVNYFTIRSCRLIDSKQGYARCSVCIVDENSIITADRGVYTACKEAGMDVLLISQGFVQLPGYDYGFLGGSSFKLSETRLAFTGSLDAHPDKERILKFLYLKGIEPVFLTDLPLFDIGSAIPITEKARA